MRSFPSTFGILIIVCLLKFVKVEDLGKQLWDAARSGTKDVVASILDKGADVNSVVFGSTPLMMAVSQCKLDVVLLLLERNASIDHRDGFDRTCLYKFCSDEIFLTLLDKGASVNLQDSYGETILHRMTENGKAKLVKALVDHGADINIANFNKENALDIAIKKGFQEIVSILRKADSDPMLILRREATMFKELNIQLQGRLVTAEEDKNVLVQKHEQQLKELRDYNKILQHNLTVQITLLKEENILMQKHELQLEKLGESKKILQEDLTAQINLLKEEKDNETQKYEMQEQGLNKQLRECNESTKILQEELNVLRKEILNFETHITKTFQEKTNLQKKVEQLLKKQEKTSEGSLKNLKAELNRKFYYLEYKVERQLEDLNRKLLILQFVDSKKREELDWNDETLLVENQ